MESGLDLWTARISRPVRYNLSPTKTSSHQGGRRRDNPQTMSVRTGLLAEGVRFELTRPFGLPVFKTGAINRSATPPEKLSLDFAIVSAIGNQLQIVRQALRLPFFGLAGEAPALQQNCSSTC